MSNKIKPLALACAALSPVATANFSAETIVQVNAVQSSGTESWLERGTGQTRYDEHDSFELGQALTSLEYGFDNGLSFHSVLNYKTEQDAGLAITQMYVKYKPVTYIHDSYKIDMKSQTQ